MMALARISKNSFAAGEISSELLARPDLVAHQDGAARLRNVFALSTGGVVRRPGLRHLATLPGDGRLIAFEFNTQQIYLLAFTDQRVHVFQDGVKLTDFAAPWRDSQIAAIAWTQNIDTLLVVHPEVEPQQITRSQSNQWTLTPWRYARNNGAEYQPFYRFAANEVTLSASATSGSVTITASHDLFQRDHQGCLMRLVGKTVKITAVTSARQVTAQVQQTLTSTAATSDWDEQSFSAVHGWPRTVGFHQNRLIIGGSRDLPNRLWMSKTGDLFNFDLGEGLADQAIEFSILSDQVNAVCAVFSGRHLQVFTSGAEWMATGDPLTPETIQLKRQTRLGSLLERYVPPRDVDGATLFAGHGGHEMREFLFTDIEQAYQADDLALLARHLVNNPIDQDFDSNNRRFLIVMQDGSVSCLTLSRRQKVTAWTRLTTNGQVLSLAVLGSHTFMLVRRRTGVYLERFDETLGVDSGIILEAESPRQQWTDLDRLEGDTVKVVADGLPHDDCTIHQGQLTLTQPARQVQVGLGFNHVIEPLPEIGTQETSSQGLKVRLVAATFRLHQTTALRVDLGRGFVELPFQHFGSQADYRFDAPVAPFTGDKTLRALGWRRHGIDPLWRIEQDTPGPFMLLSVVSQVKAG